MTIRSVATAVLTAVSGQNKIHDTVAIKQEYEKELRRELLENNVSSSDDDMVSRELLESREIIHEPLSESTRTPSSPSKMSKIKKGSIIHLTRKSHPAYLQLRKQVLENDVTEEMIASLSSTLPQYLSSQDPMAEDLNNLNNNIYTGEIELGSPARKLNVIFDTGSSDFWTSKAKSASRTFHKKVPEQVCSVQYAKGRIEGGIAYDTLTLPGIEPIKDQAFIKVVKEPENMPNIGQFVDGLMGLAFRGLSSEGAEKIILENLRDNEINGFSFFLTGTETGSQIAFDTEFPEEWGITSPTKYYSVNLGANYWWSAQAITSIGTFRSSVTVIMDTGTSFLAVPQNYYLPVVNALLGSRVKECRLTVPSGIMLCPCSLRDTAPPLKISIAHDGLEGLYKSTTYSLDSSHLFRKLPFFGECLLEIGFVSNDFPWILGDTFLRTVALSLDIQNNRIGLATRDNKEETQFSFASGVTDFESNCIGIIFCGVIVFFVIKFSQQRYPDHREPLLADHRPPIF